MLWESKMLVGFKQGPPQISTKGLAKSEEEDMIPSLISYSDSDCHTVIIFLLSQLPYVQEESDYRFPFSHHHLLCSKLPGRLQQQRSEFKFSLCHMPTHAVHYTSRWISEWNELNLEENKITTLFL